MCFEIYSILRKCKENIYLASLSLQLRLHIIFLFHENVLQYFLVQLVVIVNVEALHLRRTFPFSNRDIWNRISFEKKQFCTANQKIIEIIFDVSSKIIVSDRIEIESNSRSKHFYNLFRYLVHYLPANKQCTFRIEYDEPNSPIHFLMILKL